MPIILTDEQEWLDWLSGTQEDAIYPSGSYGSFGAVAMIWCREEDLNLLKHIVELGY